MAGWQIVLIVVFVFLPMSLMVDFHPHRERLDARGVPLSRTWDTQVTHPDPDAAHH
jgi:hypothetical protein